MAAATPGALVLVRLSAGHRMALEIFQKAYLVWVVAIVLAPILMLFLREIGAAARRTTGR
jgi:hypothetical protein